MNWHRRYAQQAKWTRSLRAYIFDQVKLENAGRVLEVGCGTGAVLGDLPDHLRLHGLDLDPAVLTECRIHAPTASLVQGDALSLPYSNGSFEIVYCHFLLLWVREPLQALLEMKRVTRPGGHVIAFAEPDYSHRIDQPDELIRLGVWQTESLKKQGADTALGARLAGLFFQAGIKINEMGTIQGAAIGTSPDEWEIEWAVIESDLAGSVPVEELQKLKILDQGARSRGLRVLHVPTHFVWGSS